MNLNVSQSQRVSAMSEDRQAEDRQLLDLVLQAQQLRRQIDALQSQKSESGGSEIIAQRRELVRLQLVWRKTLNELNRMLLAIDRLQKLHNDLRGKYHWLPETLWERFWNKAIFDRRLWLNQCSNKKKPGSPPAYMLYDPNYQGTHGAASVWNWFSGVIEVRIIGEMETNQFKEELKQRSLDAPIINDAREAGRTLGEVIPDPNRSEPSDGKILVQLLRDDPDDIFTYKNCKGGKISYRAVALLMNEGCNASEIASKFSVPPSTVTRPFKNWNNYYKPYLSEALFGEFWLPPDLSTKIREDRNGEYSKAVFKPQYPNVSLHQIVMWKLEGLSWIQIARKLQPEPETKMVILFFLDRIENQ